MCRIATLRRPYPASTSYLRSGNSDYFQIFYARRTGMNEIRFSRLAALYQ
ncbi:hypothetical protein CKO_00496 [Citrobacter koseri ATCC BAA-895]|uniref:Uncharacterized protein n=1 Tax=Citrobacter koseri (strain ATCC BAA-895 / CDC 4225-83 / SGSC4696) TaxID=290338 RepID=A8ADT9_CITK8|nr:hypothetical protein CKO_00496 [Citrobacter koseri ATCC BAA-895]